MHLKCQSPWEVHRTSKSRGHILSRLQQSGHPAPKLALISSHFSSGILQELGLLIYFLFVRLRLWTFLVRGLVSLLGKSYSQNMEQLSMLAKRTPGSASHKVWAQPGGNTDTLDGSAKAAVHITSCVLIMCTVTLKGFRERWVTNEKIWMK